jgi:hypothetical protein
MFASRSACVCVVWLSACSGSESTQPFALEPRAAGPNDSTSTSDSAAAPEQFRPEFVTFVEPGSGFETQSVRDADRDVVHFDLQGQSMIWSDSADEVTGWVAEGNELSWDRSGVAFRVRFGSEGGARLAFFTETGAGTICNLEVTAPEQLSISATRETPPNP